MKVVHNPKDPQWSTQVTCRHCKSILEIAAADIYTTLLGSGMDDFNSAWYYVVDCGVCSRFIELDEAKLPEWVIRERKDVKERSSRLPRST